MDEMTSEDFRNQIVRHEGLKLKPYRCSANKLTIGVGRNLEDVGITEDEAYMLLEKDIDRAAYGLGSVFPVVKGLEPARYFALINMTFNLGLNGINKFKNMWRALDDYDYDRAADEMLDSKWARQVGNRANELAEQMRTGKYNGSD